MIGRGAMLGAVGGLLLASSTVAGTITLTDVTLDGGGGIASGGGLSLSATFGQPDVGAASGTGAVELRGGFWVYPYEFNVPVLLQASSLRLVPAGVEVAWMGSGMLGGERFHVLRADGSADPAEVSPPEGLGVDARGEGSFVDAGVVPGATYRYFLGISGPEAQIRLPLGEIRIPAAAHRLEQNRPNPFNPRTAISFYLPTAEAVRLVVYDGAGREIRVLVDESMSASLHTVVWDGTDADGRKVSSGVYWYRLHAGSFTDVRRMTLLE